MDHHIYYFKAAPVITHDFDENVRSIVAECEKYWRIRFPRMGMQLFQSCYIDASFSNPEIDGDALVGRYIAEFDDSATMEIDDTVVWVVLAYAAQASFANRRGQKDIESIALNRAYYWLGIMRSRLVAHPEMKWAGATARKNVAAAKGLEKGKKYYGASKEIALDFIRSRVWETRKEAAETTSLYLEAVSYIQNNPGKPMRKGLPFTVSDIPEPALGKRVSLLGVDSIRDLLREAEKTSLDLCQHFKRNSNKRF